MQTFHSLIDMIDTLHTEQEYRVKCIFPLRCAPWLISHSASLLNSGWEFLKNAASTAIQNLPGALSAGWELLKSGISAVGEAIGQILKFNE